MIGPLTACGLADAYGAGFEFTSPPYVKKHNRMEGYVPHPKFTQRPANAYTDDTQMALGLIEHLLATDLADITSAGLAARWVACFKRDERTGYSQGFYSILQKVSTGAELQATLTPHSTKNGGAMRAFPCGYLRDPAQVRDLAMMQASITHATWRGMTAAAAAALMFHYCYHQVGPRQGLVGFLNEWVPGIDWTLQAMKQTTGGGVQTDGIDTVRAALHCLLGGQSLTDVVQTAVSLRGDTDTVAAIAAACASVCSEVRNAYPDTLFQGLETGTYGRDWLIQKDAAMQVEFPPAWVTTAKPVRAEVVKAKAPVEATVDEPEPGPLDWLFK